MNPNKFYAVSAGKFYESTDGGATFTQTAATGLPAEGALNFKALPGVEGDIWLAGGSDNSGVYGLWHSTNSGASFTKLSNVQKADGVGFGKAAPGQSYPAIYVSAQIDGVRGFFRLIDSGATWANQRRQPSIRPSRGFHYRRSEPIRMRLCRDKRTRHPIWRHDGEQPNHFGRYVYADQSE